MWVRLGVTLVVVFILAIGSFCLLNYLLSIPGNKKIDNLIVDENEVKKAEEVKKKYLPSIS